MDDQPGFHFAPFTFLTGFGVGIFSGVLLALVALALVQDNNDAGQTVVLAEPTQAVSSSSTMGSPTPEQRPRTASSADVRLGPGTAFAVIGSLPRGEYVEVVGRDAGSLWAAIRFPPGSAARGWVEVKELEGVSSLDRLAVLLPTPLPRSVSTNTAPFDLDSGSGNGGFATPGVTAPGPVGTRTATTPTPAAGPTDLVILRAVLLADGRVQVTVGNRGPGDLVGKSVFVIVRDLTLRSEQLVANQATIPVGGVINLQTTAFRLTSETDLQVIVDPFGTLQDGERSNNQFSITLTPAAVPTATKTPLE